jgi:hypothetical protein
MRPVAGALPRVLGPSWWLEAEPSVVETQSADEPSVAGTACGADEPELAEIPPLVESAPVRRPEPATPFERFVDAVAAVALNRGATRAAVAVSALLTHGRLTQGGVDPALLAELARRKILAPGGGHASPEFALATSAWRAVLDGTGGDLAGCGSATLDAWSAELLAALTNAPRAEVPELKRELRRAGIAAFGMLAVA